MNLSVETFQSIGFYVESAKNGKEDLQKVRDKSFDIILMDLEMPIMNGVLATIESRKSGF